MAPVTRGVKRSSSESSNVTNALKSTKVSSHAGIKTRNTRLPPKSAIDIVTMMTTRHANRQPPIAEICNPAVKVAIPSKKHVIELSKMKTDQVSAKVATVGEARCSSLKWFLIPINRCH
jgi:hypothetical protein